MNDENPSLPPLGEYVGSAALREDPVIATIYPTRHSLEWATRQHRRKLVEAGAMITVAGRMMFHPERFKRAIVEVGREITRVSS